MHAAAIETRAILRWSNPKSKITSIPSVKKDSADVERIVSQTKVRLNHGMDNLFENIFNFY